jgi:hypothetical protein
MTSIQYGISTPDSPRKEGRQEAQRQDNLQQQTRADSGSPTCKRDRIIYVENSSNIHDPFVLPEIGTVDELIEKMCERFPAICTEHIGMKISTTRMGTIHRVILTDRIPYKADTLFITLYLKKHPPISVGKIEQ